MIFDDQNTQNDLKFLEVDLDEKVKIAGGKARQFANQNVFWMPQNTLKLLVELDENRRRECQASFDHKNTLKMSKML